MYSHCLPQSLNYTFYHSCHQQVKSLTSSDLLLAIRRQANSSCLSETNICCQVYVPNRNPDLLVLSIKRQANSSCLSETNICSQVYAANRNPDLLLSIKRQASFSCLSDTNICCQVYAPLHQETGKLFLSLRYLHLLSGICT